ncbi:phenylacetate--CoA ligase family protein [Aureibaculum conchae]|uniref:hypothetical protein n=1 Tax=Aureibaculum sp. 2308TA14-22 TaxID=3108392 RepID=UPI00339370B4
MNYSKFLQNIILPFGDVINKSSFIKSLKYWRQVDNYSAEELSNLQKENLKKILVNAIENVPFYKNIDLVGHNPENWLKQFPILTKKILNNNTKSLINKKSKGLIEYRSSGSSGVQSTIYMNKEEQAITRSILIRWWEWAGYNIGDHLIQTGITPKRGFLKSIKDIVFNTLYINAFSLSDNDVIKVLEKINNSKYSFTIAGYASSLNVFAEVAIKYNYKIELKIAISFGDKLFSHYRKNVQEAFKCKVFDTYGCSEGLLIASEKDLKYKYIFSPHVYLEILDDNNEPVPDGIMGNVVCTRLDGFSMPLIRYRIGDLAIKLPKEKYPPQRDLNYPLLQQVVGRETDTVKTINGKTLIVHSFTGIFEYISEIRQFKVYQYNKEGIVIHFIKSKGFSNKVLKNITLELQKIIEDSSFTIDYKEVDYIKPSKSGKPQMIESRLKE